MLNGESIMQTIALHPKLYFYCRLSMLLFVGFLCLSSSSLWADTTVSGVLSANTTWTRAGSPYTLSADLQISSGVTLTINAGVSVIGNSHSSIKVFGTLTIQGSSSARVVLKNVVIASGANAVDAPYGISIQYAQIDGGSILGFVDYASYGSLVLRDSILTGLDFFYIYYPVVDCYIERNVFTRCGGFNVGQKSANVYVRNNLFDQQTTPYAVQNWDTFPGSTIVQYNTFLSTGAIAVSLYPTASPAALDASNNYWNTTDTNVINDMIFDRNDSLACAGTINYLPILTAPDPNTPTSGQPGVSPTVTAISPDSVPAGSSAFTLTVNGTQFTNTSYVTWNGNSQPTTFVSSSQLKASIAASGLTSPGTVAIAVVTPGAGTSNSVSFSINLQLTFAQMALGGGYKTAILLTNTATATTHVVLKPRQANEQAWTDTIIVNGQSYAGLDQIPFDLPASGTAKIILEGGQSVKAGYLQVASGSTNVAASYFFELYSNGIKTTSAGSPASQASHKFLFPVELTSTVDTGVAIAPSFKLPTVPLIVTLRDTSGSSVLQVPLTIDGHRAQFFSEIFSGLQKPFVGSVSIEADEMIYLTVLRLEQSSAAYLITSVPPLNTEGQ
jgi:hypothetical protein